MTGTFNDCVQFWADHIPLQTVVGAGGTLAFVQPAAGATDTGARYNNDIPYVINYAELLMYQDPELDFLATRTTDSSQVTVSGSRYVTIPPSFVVVERVTLVTPAGKAPDDAGATRVPLIRATPAVINMMWPAASVTAAPKFGLTHWSIFDQQETSPASQIRIGPTPDGAYTVEYAGTFRPAPLAQTAAATTFLTTNLFALFTAASMVAWAGLMKNYVAAGVQGAVDDPGMAVTWMSVYNGLKKGAAVEEARKKSLSAGTSVYSPAPLAQMPR